MPTTADWNLDIDLDAEVVVRYKLIDDLMKATQRVEEHVEIHATSTDESYTFTEAVSNPCWKKAMEEEMVSVNENKTWSLKDLLAGHQAIRLQWVFKLKCNEDVQVGKHKVCLVAKGYVQKERIDFNEIFAPVARLELVRMLLVIVVHHSWEVPSCTHNNDPHKVL
jgi:hypothetical protein